MKKLDKAMKIIDQLSKKEREELAKRLADSCGLVIKKSEK